jgi:hypothetical protein
MIRMLVRPLSNRGADDGNKLTPPGVAARWLAPEYCLRWLADALKQFASYRVVVLETRPTGTEWHLTAPIGEAADRLRAITLRRRVPTAGERWGRQAGRPSSFY